MRFLIPLIALALEAPPTTPSVSFIEPETLVRDIEEEWRGKIVRDEASPGRPVVEILFHCDSAVPDAIIEQLAVFTRLRKLDLVGGQRLTDKGLEYVGNLTGLESLSLRNRFVTTQGLKHLAQLPKLKTLLLWDLPLTEQNATALAGCASLERLELRNLGVSPEAVNSLKQMTCLNEIDGFRTGGTFKSADEVQKEFPKLKVRIRQ